MILVCGDREWTNQDAIRLVLSTETIGRPGPFTLIHGDCRGADKLAAAAAEELGFFTVESYPADWETHGKAAGPIRNRQMLNRQPDVVLAFHSRLRESKGTMDTILEANARGIRVRIIP